MLVLVSAQFSHADSNISNDEARNFFSLYHTMIQDRSKAVIQLISEDALLMSETHTVNNKSYITQYQLKNVFRFIETVQSFLHQNKEDSDFERIRITREGDQVKISAQRFSSTHCYLDKGYYLIIERERNFIKVIEEKINIQKNASCDELDDIQIDG